MKNKTNRFILAAGTLLVCVCALAACVDTPEWYIYVRNTQDKEITVTVDYLGNNSWYESETGKRVGSLTIPPNTTAEFEPNRDEEGHYRVRDTTGNNTVYIDWDEGTVYTKLVIF